MSSAVHSLMGSNVFPQCRHSLRSTRPITGELTMLVWLTVVLICLFIYGSTESFIHSLSYCVIRHHHHRQPWAQCPLVSDAIVTIAAYLGQRGLTPAGLPNTTAQCHLTILSEAVLFCLNHPSFRTPGSLSFCCRSF